MNFFQRRAFLKKANFLDLTPQRLVQEEIDADHVVTLLMPKFSSNFSQKHFGSKLKSPFFRIKLDKLGSAAWLAIDGKKTVEKIAEELSQKSNENIERVQERLIKFLSLFYQQKLVTFVELLKV